MPSKFTLDYYKTEDGPCLILFGNLDADLGAVSNLFVQLSQADDGFSVRLDTQPFIRRHEDSLSVSVQLKTVIDIDDDRGPFLECPSHDRLVWMYSPLMWESTVEQVESMIALKSPCHQYFAESQGNNFFVKLSVGEISSRA